jgi:hypothetical protein
MSKTISTNKNSDEMTELKECFIITPIGSPDSEIFKKTEGLINSVLRPVLNEHGFEPLPAHQIDSTGSINKQIIEKIVNCELVIANLTSVNPNVMYELAIRHSFGKRVITVAEHGTKLPFDIIDQRTIFYSDSMHGVDKFKPELSKAIKKCIEENEELQNISNPIYDAVKQIAEIKSLPEKDRDALEIILQKINNLIPHETKVSDKLNRNENLYFLINCKNSNQIIDRIQSILNTKKINYNIEVITENYIAIRLINLSTTSIDVLKILLRNIEGVDNIETSDYPF